MYTEKDVGGSHDTIRPCDFDCTDDASKCADPLSAGHGPARMRTVDETKPHIWIEPTRPPANSSREFGDTAAIHLVVPNVSRVDVLITRTETNAVAFDISAKNSRTASMCKAHWLKAVMITGLAILHSEMAEAEQLRLECSVKTECYPETIIRRGWHCTPRNPSVSMLVEIDFETKTWVEFVTHEDGKQTSASGNLKSVTQYEITLDERSYADGRKGRETISDFWGLLRCPI